MTARRAAARGARQLAIATLCAKIAGVGSQIVLARVLVEEDFGAFAFVIGIVTLLGTLATFECRRDILRDPDCVAQRAKAYLGLQGGIAVVLGLALALAAPALSAWLPSHSGSEGARVAPFLQALCAVPLLEALRLPCLALLEARGRFAAVARLEAGAALGQALAAVTLALAGAGPWALIGGFYFGAATRCAGTWALAGTAWLGVERAAGTRLAVLRFALPILAANLLTAWYWKVDDILVFAGLGPAAAGLYAFAFELPRALFQVTDGMSRVALTVLGRASADREAQRRVFSVAVRATFALLAPATLLGLVHGELLIGVVFGERWVPATHTFQVLLVLVLLRGTFRHWTDVATTAGRPELLTRAALAAALALPLFGLVALRWGILGMAFAVLAAWCVPMPFCLLWVRRRLEVRFGELLRPGCLAFTLALALGYGLVAAAGAPGAAVSGAIGCAQLMVFAGVLIALDRDLCALFADSVLARRDARG